MILTLLVYLMKMVLLFIFRLYLCSHVLPRSVGPASHLQVLEQNTPLDKAFKVADDILRNGVVGITEIIVRPGLINVDFADVRSIMGNAGTALMGMGEGSGKTRSVDAAAAAISSPLLEFPVNNAKGIVFNIMGGPDMTLQEVRHCLVHPAAT